MNYLAHFYLAEPDPALMFGNFIGDGVKGSDFNHFSEGVVRGIQFHRFIDTYTDAHPQVMESKKLFYDTQSKFSGVVTDVLYDHFLAMHWPRFYGQPLGKFAHFCYETIGAFNERMPPKSQGFFRYMVANNILSNYATIDGIERVFRGMDSRTKFPSNMLDSIETMEEHFESLEAHFLAFFPELINACKEWKTAH